LIGGSCAATLSGNARSLALALGSTAVHCGVRMRRTAVGAFALLSTIGCDDLCSNKVLTDVASSDAHNHVVVFTRDCGATTGFSTQVSILPVGRAISDGGNVLIVDDDQGRAPNGLGGGPSVAVRWIDARTVELHYDRRVRVFKQEAVRDGIQVRIIQDSQ
jgi:hypothetical protein